MSGDAPSSGRAGPSLAQVEALHPALSVAWPPRGCHHSIPSELTPGQRSPQKGSEGPRSAHSFSLLLSPRVSLASRELLEHLETEVPLAPWVLLA